MRPEIEKKTRVPLVAIAKIGLMPDAYVTSVPAQSSLAQLRNALSPTVSIGLVEVGPLTVQ